jgi:hypothetical protein
VIALDAKNGRVRWSRKLPSRAESSPLVASGALYFGTEDGTVYALRASDGAVRWRYKADGAVKGGLALDQGRLFFGDYGGASTRSASATARRSGRPRARARAFGLKAGSFYSTPAAAYGRVYIGSLDGFVYSFAASNGKLAWRHTTGNYVYSSPAVASVPARADGLHRLLRRAPVRVRRPLGRRALGAQRRRQDLGRPGRRRRPRLLLEPRRGARRPALGAVTGKLVWATGRGAFNPVISDGNALYFLGYSSLFMLSTPARRARRARPRPPGAARPGPAGARGQAQGRQRSPQQRVRKRRVARRVAARRAAVRRNRRLRRQHRESASRATATRSAASRARSCASSTATGRTVCRPRKG